MAGPRAKRCATCGRGLAASEVYYRFTLVLEGEQDVLEPPVRGTTSDELGALLAQLEAGPEDPREWEEQVHWERTGVVCAACRAVVVRMLATAEAAGPH